MLLLKLSFKSFCLYGPTEENGRIQLNLLNVIEASQQIATKGHCRVRRLLISQTATKLGLTPTTGDEDPL